jgi:benzodiazapine receptor
VLALVGFVGLCLLVSAADGAVIAGTSRAWYLSLIRPPGTPPNWLLGLIWSIVHVMIGVAGWLVWRRSTATRPLRLWGWQLAANALWAPAFFAVRSPPLALMVSLVLLALILLTAQAFVGVRRPAALLLAPYFAWTGYVAYLTAGFWWLNPT